MKPSTGSRWALVRGGATVWAELRAASRALPRGVWPRWLRTLGLGMATTVALMAAITLLARWMHGRGLQAWDHATLLRLERLPISFDAAIWWEAFGASSMLIPLVVIAAVVAARARRPVLAATLVAAFALAKPIFLVGWRMWDRARPDLIAGGVAAPPLHSFPSGHAVQTVALYGLLAYLWLRRSGSVVERFVGTAAWLALTAIVGVARLRLGAHWPSDVIAGSVVGLAWLATLIAALRRAEAVGGR